MPEEALDGMPLGLKLVVKIKERGSGGGGLCLQHKLRYSTALVPRTFNTTHLLVLISNVNMCMFIHSQLHHGSWLMLEVVSTSTTRYSLTPGRCTQGHPYLRTHLPSTEVVPGEKDANVIRNCLY